MAEASNTPPRHMSLIPYPYESGEIVLRRGDAVVVYDAQSRQLSVRNAADQALEVTECPYCHRPMHDEEYLGRPGDHIGDDSEPRTASSSSARGRPYPAGQSYIDPNYFRKLAASQRPSPDNSTASSTPNRGFLHQQAALRSGRSRDVSGSSNQPPPGAEFVGSEPQTNSGQGISNDAFSPGTFKKFFTEVGELGRGGNGVVLLVEHAIDGFSLGRFACKRIPVGDNHDWLQKVLIEVSLLQNIRHSNLVAYHWVWLENYQQSKFGPSVPYLWILQEYCNGGDLHDYVLGSQKQEFNAKNLMKERLRRRSRAEPEPVLDLRGPSQLTFEEIFSFFRDITSGLHHLHSKNYIHRDLKPSNCLIQRDGTSTKVLISDFGEVQAAGAKRGSTGATGTISYCAPEVLRRSGANGEFGNFTTKSDIFSLGMIVYFMCFGRLPYRNADDINEETEDLDELRAEISQWSGFDDKTRPRTDLPERLYFYLKKLLSVDPSERPSTDEILASIKGGAGLGTEDENSSHHRVSPVDSPRIRPSMPSKQQQRTSFSNSTAVPAIIRKNSNAHDRQPTSPLRRRHSGKNAAENRTSRSPADSDNNSIVVRARSPQSPMPSSSSPSPKPSPTLLRPQSPRLMLPPPPPERGFWTTLFLLMRQDSTIAVLRLAVFALKVFSVTLPCTPFAARGWVLFLTLGLAVLDVGVLPFVGMRSALLLGVHVAIVGFARRLGYLCEGGAGLVWGDGRGFR